MSIKLKHKYTPLAIRCKDVKKVEYGCLDCGNLHECFKYSKVIIEE